MPPPARSTRRCSSSASGTATSACVAAGAPELAHHSDRLPALREDAEGRADGALRDALEIVDDARARLALNVDPQLAFEALAYRLERLLSTGVS